MANVAFTAAEIRPLTENGAVLRQHTAGAEITVGHLVHIAADGDVEHADADAGTPAEQAIGIAVESYDGETTIDAGNPVTVCVYGPVSGYDSMTPGDTLYVSNTAGRIDDGDNGAFSRVIGYAERAGIVFVSPVQSEAASS